MADPILEFDPASEASGTPLTITTGNYGLALFSAPAPPTKYQWASSVDTEGSALASRGDENRTVTVGLEVTGDAALSTLQAKVAKLHREGGTLKYTTPAGNVVTYDVLARSDFDPQFDHLHYLGDVTAVTLALPCKPYGRAPLVTGPSASGSSPVLELNVTGVPGDVDAETRLVITDTEPADRRFVQWGAGLDMTSPEIIDSDSLVTAGFGGVGATRTGAYDPNAAGNNVLRASVTSIATSVCGTGAQTHTGTWRVFARVYAEGSGTQIRLTYQDKDGSASPNPWVTILQEDAFQDVDLGLVTLREVPVGGQTWSGRIDGLRPAGAANLDVDFLALFPVDAGYGVARAVESSATGLLTAYDKFDGTTAGGTLNARVPPLGAAWATSGVATDFVFVDANIATLRGESVSRTSSSASFRYGVIGSDMTNQHVEAKVGAEFNASTQGTGECGVILHWTDASNYLRFTVTTSIDTVLGVSTRFHTFTLTKVVAGVATVLATGTKSSVIPIQHYVSLRCKAYASGLVVAEAFDIGGVSVFQASVTDAVIATAGALEDGKAGIIDSGNGTDTPAARTNDEIIVYTPAPEPVTIYSGRDLQVRPDQVIRANAAGTLYGKPSKWEGFPIRLPPGDSRVIVRANRVDLETGVYGTIDDTVQAQVFYSPRYLVVPD